MSRSQATWQALGMTVVVELATRDGLDRARRIVEEELAAADAAYSPVRRDTELARVEAGGRQPRCASDARLLDAIESPPRGPPAPTGGLVDPTVGAGPDAGRGHDRGRRPNDRAPRAAARPPGPGMAGRREPTDATATASSARAASASTSGRRARR